MAQIFSEYSYWDLPHYRSIASSSDASFFIARGLFSHTVLVIDGYKKRKRVRKVAVLVEHRLAPRVCDRRFAFVADHTARARRRVSRLMHQTPREGDLRRRHGEALEHLARPLVRRVQK